MFKREKVNKLIKAYQESILRKITVEENGSYILKENIKFNSPSKAASFVTGSSTNGRIAWIDKDGNTLGSKY